MKPMEFDPRIEIETERLLLRYLREEDTHDIYENINSDKEVLRYFLDRYVEKESEMTLGRTISYCLNAKRYLFAIVLKETNETIGMILQCSTPDIYNQSSEIGYAIGRKHWNKGYVTEAAKAMIEFLFSHGVHKVMACHLVGNDASKRVIEKLGMSFEGRRKEEIYYHETYYDVDSYAILAPKGDSKGV